MLIVASVLLSNPDESVPKTVIVTTCGAGGGGGGGGGGLEPPPPPPHEIIDNSISMRKPVAIALPLSLRGRNAEGSKRIPVTSRLGHSTVRSRIDLETVVEVALGRETAVTVIWVATDDLPANEPLGGANIHVVPFLFGLQPNWIDPLNPLMALTIKVKFADCPTLSVALVLLMVAFPKSPT